MPISNPLSSNNSPTKTIRRGASKKSGNVKNKQSSGKPQSKDGVDLSSELKVPAGSNRSDSTTNRQDNLSSALKNAFESRSQVPVGEQAEQAKAPEPAEAPKAKVVKEKSKGVMYTLMSLLSKIPNNSTPLTPLAGQHAFGRPPE